MRNAPGSTIRTRTPKSTSWASVWGWVASIRPGVGGGDDLIAGLDGNFGECTAEATGRPGDEPHASRRRNAQVHPASDVGAVWIPAPYDVALCNTTVSTPPSTRRMPCHTAEF